MRLSTDISYLTIDEPFGRPYPPLGFVPFKEHALGNGDCFGFYWPIGYEARPPLVMEMVHDAWSLAPCFSSVAAFLRVASRGTPDDWVRFPSLCKDAASPLANFQSAREDLQAKNFDSAVTKLEVAVRALPEYAKAQSTYLGQLLRMRRYDEAFEAAIRAVIGPPCFSGPSRHALSWLKKQRSCPAHLSNDPIWVARHELGPRPGRKRYDDYPVVWAAIETYISQGESVKAATLMQSYGELMYAERPFFQERHNFDVAAYISWQAERCAELGLPRALASSCS